MRKLFITFLSSLLLISCAAAQDNDVLRLAKNSKTSYVIALAADAIPAEKTAAAQLQKYLQEVTGAQFPIQDEAVVKADVPQILVGAGTRARVLLPQQDWSTLGSDGIVIKSVGDNLVLAGGRPRGTLYAVFQFLQDEVGCRWWTPTEKAIPQRSTLEVAAQNVSYVPPFRYREHFTTAMRENPEFATIMRENGHFQTQTVEWGGHYNILGFVHTFATLLPTEKYFKDHPEWYSDPENGNQPATAASKMPDNLHTQLCLSNPQVLEELTKQALAWIKENPDAGYISISQNDNRDNYCRDAPSMKLAEEEGSQAAPLLKFVNQVAEKIHQQYPDFKVETLAYLYSEKPPKTIRPAKNVVIRLAPLSADFGHPLDSDWNAETRDNLLAWAKIAPELFVWNYVANFSNTALPHPNWQGLGPDLRFFAANNVQGVFEQGDEYTGGVGDFVQLRTWLIAQLMWNPQLDQEKLTAEFLQGYYGAAGPHLQQYLALIEKSYLAQNVKLSASNLDFGFLSLDVTNQAFSLFEKAAEAVKGDEALSDRVRRERLALDIATLYQYDNLQQTAAREGKKFLGPQNPSAAMAEYIKTAQEFGIRRWNENNTFAAHIPELERMFAASVPLPEFARKYPATDVIDIQQNRFRLYRPGTLTELVKDAAASNGEAAAATGETNEWAIQADLGRYLDATPHRWHAYAMVRVETKDGALLTGDSLGAGIYDSAKDKTIGEVGASLKDTVGVTYQRLDLGVHELSGGMFIWFAPRNKAMVALYVDRIILIRE